MPRFFVDPAAVNGDKALITGGDAVHIGRSLRMRLGDEVTLCCEGMDYTCRLLTISDEVCTAQILDICGGSGEPNIKLTLYQAMPKADKLELIVQKAVELGASAVVPVLTGRCVSRPDEKSFAKKRQRLNKIALEAAKQCGRSIVPTVGELLSFDKAAKALCENELAVICYEKGGRPFNEVIKNGVKTVGLFIGSEGGFEQAEVEACQRGGAVAVGMGSRILRCETAPIAAISIIMNLTGNM